MAYTFDFSGRSALITGAASGIGAASARWLDDNGIEKLWLIDRNGEGLDALDLSCAVEKRCGDVADETFWSGLEEEIDALDHAVVNAGIATGGEIATLAFDDWRKVMDVNLDGAFLTLRTALRKMLPAARGSIVVTASVTGLKPVPGIGGYGTSKAAVAHLARIAAAENARHGIRINAIAPGGVDTAIWDSGEDFRAATRKYGREAAIGAMGKDTPRGRFATPEELAGDIGFLLSDMAANVTGTVLTSDGGYTL
ncbi:SDR family oxidoreductase [Altererythrobacter aurantiacus]|uniref:SDR family oxidoreductase n=1 Tax=Parapontixanthobacter aurantiacus TaxID=1463599 RepID=A0A844ZCA9_9SPHN|nr:SDR family oxidoreductase [Parapontixanthobacter aurantiacus]MXO84796.1 SDR family oxidoreductase [Parapontixanthobacter aurantiacus]